MTILALPFLKGYGHYVDAIALIGEHKAKVTLVSCVGRCNSFNAQVMIDAQWIAQSVYLNPDNVAGFDIVVTALITEILIVMQEYQCFETGYNTSPWEFVDIKPAKLYIQPSYREVERNYPLFQRSAPVLL